MLGKVYIIYSVYAALDDFPVLFINNALTLRNIDALAAYYIQYIYKNMYWLEWELKWMEVFCPNTSHV